MSSSSSASQPALVSRIGPYRLSKTLGVGTFCKVKLATHELTNEKVAIKILNRKRLRKMDMGSKVWTEIEILRKFSHPHIVRLYEVIETPTDIYAVVEYVPGGELFDYIVGKGKLEEREARLFFQQIISGLDYCHYNDVVHRDLKPENLLLDDQNHLKIADFGLSGHCRDGILMKTSCGSPNYASPQVISGNFYAGPEVDVWSCGVILFAMLCGSLPFDDENIRTLFRKIKTGYFVTPPHVSKDADHLIRCMLEVDPLRRITIKQIRAHPWFQESLPLYLNVATEEFLEKSSRLDTEIVTTMLQLGFHQDRIIQALRLGSDLLTTAKYTYYTEHRQTAVVYHLLLDKKRKKEQDTKTISKSEKKKGSKDDLMLLRPSSSSPKTESPPVDIESRETKTSKVPSLTQQYHATVIKYSHAQWSVGKFFAHSAPTIIAELCRVLKKYNFEWKLLSTYHLKARHPPRLLNKEGKPVSHSKIVKISFQLYKDTRLYVLDIHRLYGDVFLFMDFSSHILCDMCLSSSNFSSALSVSPPNSNSLTIPSSPPLPLPGPPLSSSSASSSSSSSSSSMSSCMPSAASSTSSTTTSIITNQSISPVPSPTPTSSCSIVTSQSPSNIMTDVIVTKKSVDMDPNMNIYHMPVPRPMVVITRVDSKSVFNRN
eukprot:TRINITY_DN3167_c0_g1_i1.p1 TRINITY_DN3167_c0_g1~~TRINITY_DN3167_c0_g1_i1.p1  ORF type:complete len:657 (-),score=101.06 TRINITY_DN3167_c0_g1_i1:343-2313(-)